MDEESRMSPNLNRPFDFFASASLPAPRVTAAQAEGIAAGCFRLAASAEQLGSQQDANFLLRLGDGTATAILKIANPVFRATEIEAQDDAADLIAAAIPGLRVATVLRDPAGARQVASVPTQEGLATVRLLRFLPGGTLSGTRHLPSRTVESMGTIAGQVSIALRDFRHEGLRRVLQWDPRYADRVIALLLPHLPGAERRATVQAATAEAWTRTGRVADLLPRQAVHLDLTSDNLVCSPGSRLPSPDGVIDFGDLTDSWAVGELAVTLASMLRHDGVEPNDLLPAVRAFHAVRPLRGPEAEALWPLVVLRAASLVVSGWQQSVVDGDNAYVEESLDDCWRVFQQATSVPSAVMARLIEQAAGLENRPVSAPSPVLPLVRDLAPAAIALLDLRPEADSMDRGAWLEAGAEDRLAASLLAGGAAAVASTYAQPRLTAAPALSATAPATVATGIDVWLSQSAALQAPVDGTITEAAPGRAAITCGPWVLAVSFAEAVRPGMPAGTLLLAGSDLVTLPAGARARISLRLADAPDIPALVPTGYAAGWLALAADPGPLIGLPAADRTPQPDLLARRDAVFATVQGHYYARPPRIERGWRHYLVSADGRSYLDMVNNVTILGHAHPGLEQAISRQLRKLNTNSRFHYASVVECHLPGAWDQGVATT